MKKLKNVDKNTSLLFVLVILIFAVMAVLQPSAFLGLANIQGMCIQFPEFGIMALGMMLPGMAAGWIADTFSYTTFFIWTMVCCAATIGVCYLIKVDSRFGKKGE